MVFHLSVLFGMSSKSSARLPFLPLARSLTAFRQVPSSPPPLPSSAGRFIFPRVDFNTSHGVRIGILRRKGSWQASDLLCQTSLQEPGVALGTRLLLVDHPSSPEAGRSDSAKLFLTDVALLFKRSHLLDLGLPLHTSVLEVPSVMGMSHNGTPGDRAATPLCPQSTCSVEYLLRNSIRSFVSL